MNTKILQMISVILFATSVGLAEPQPPIVNRSERQTLYLMTLDKMRAVTKPINRVEAEQSIIDVNLSEKAVGYRGELVPFWRTRVMPDRWLSPPAWAISSQDPIVALLERETGRDLQSYPQNSLVGDSISCVRLLGGWRGVWKNGEMKADTPVTDYDLAYRVDGVIQYRWELLAKRLDPIVNNGLTPLIVLDKVPYCFSHGDGNSTYGQNLAPNDFEEWGRFIEELCEELVDRYGYNRVNTWRFRLGTEMDNPNHWEDGADDSLVKYLKMYDYATAAIKKILPGAKVGACNFNSMFAGQIDRKVPPMEVFKHFSDGINYATGEIGSPVDFVSVSSYGMYWMGGEFDHPDAAAHGYSTETLRLHANLLKNLRDVSPRFSDIPIEIHEHGTLFNKDEQVSYEPGAFGAAWTAAQYIVGLEEGVAELFHWSESERINGKIILYGHAWLRVMMEKLVGGQVWVLNVENATTRLFMDAIAVKKDDKLYVMIACYDAERANDTVEEIRVQLPSSLKGAAVRKIVLSKENAPYDAMYKALQAADMAKGAINTTSAMATEAGRKMLREQSKKYVSLQEASFDWQEAEVSQANGVFGINTNVPVPSVTLFEITNSSSQ